MAMKKWFRHLQPVQLYLMLGLTLLFFIVQLVMSHMTHAHILLVDSYHMLCNVIALIGCIITIKYGSANVEREENQSSKESMSGDEISVGSKIPPASSCHIHNATAGFTEPHHNHSHTGSSEERKLKNTFGWARIDVLVMLIGCVFLASLCFSLVVEAVQTLVHIDHQDEMHHPIPVMCVGAIGLLLNGLCYLLIGGYTFHQGSFLHVTPSGNVVLDGNVTQDSAQKEQRCVSTENHNPVSPPQISQRQGLREMCRDISSCVFVIVGSLIVHFTDQHIAKFVDPALAIVSATLLFVLSYPYLKESSSILLQTIPDTINIDSLRSELLKAFPDIINVHDLHVWRLTATKVFSTAHIIFLNSKDYVRITKDVTEFFHDQGITQVTIQPEFFKMDNRSNLTQLPSIHENHCLVQCRELGCHSRHCCSHNVQDFEKVTVGENGHHQHVHSNSYSVSKNNKKHHVTTKVKDVTQKKSLPHTDPASACRINMSFETTSNEGDSRTYTCEESLEDLSLTHSSSEQELSKVGFENNKKEKNVNTNLMYSTMEEGMVINDLQEETDTQTEVTTNDAQRSAANDLHNVGDENLPSSNLQQGIKITPEQTVKQESAAHDGVLSGLALRSSTLSESLPPDPSLPNDSPTLKTISLPDTKLSVSENSATKSNTESSKSVLADDVPTYIVQSKPNVPSIIVTEVVAKPDMNKLRSKSEAGKKNVS